MTATAACRSSRTPFSLKIFLHLLFWWCWGRMSGVQNLPVEFVIAHFMASDSHLFHPRWTRMLLVSSSEASAYIYSGFSSNLFMCVHILSTFLTPGGEINIFIQFKSFFGSWGSDGRSAQLGLKMTSFMIEFFFFKVRSPELQSTPQLRPALQSTSNGKCTGIDIAL